jgi:hypothetical protein
MVFRSLLVHPGTIFYAVLGNDNGQIAGRKEESLITEHTRHPGQRHWAAVPAKLRKSLSFCNAIGVPCHIFFLPKRAEGSNRPIRKLVMKLKPKRRLLGSSSCNRSCSLKCTRISEVHRTERDSMPIEVRLANPFFLSITCRSFHASSSANVPPADHGSPPETEKPQLIPILCLFVP